MKSSLILTAALLLGAAPPASAQILDVLSGHYQDLKARFGAHQKVAGQILKQGRIDTQAAGQDLIHNSSGHWYLVKVGNQLYLQSGEDFRSSPGPDYHVYVSHGPAIKDIPEFGPQQTEVARLTKPNGAGFYLLKTENANDVASVLIWCKQFKEYIGSADLVPVKP